MKCTQQHQRLLGRGPSMRSHNRIEPRRDAPVTCDHCGRTVRRKSRQQRFCSRRCRVSAHRAKAAVEPMKIRPRCPRSGDETHPVKNASNSSRLRGQFSGSTARIFGPAHVIGAEVFGRRNWQRVVSSDGVAVEIAQLRPRAPMAAPSNSEQSAFQTHGESAACQDSSGSVESQE